ncbi:amidohydrolase [Desulforegula conservatrix]|uniref:amidohydrolase n=1 Tax=Desulforegula conservatrix TaxID=153026 RepID=UPI0004036C39|nr:amidohydrolase [Desulforegula conservatrix]
MKDILVELRKKLHEYPEESGKEKQTREVLLSFLEKFKPDVLIDPIGETGFAAIFGDNPRKTVLLRAEMDAVSLGIGNTGNSRYSHSCGHDGHMAILAGVAAALHMQRPFDGRVVLLFQPAEETGKGALSILNSSIFNDINPDVVFSLHNLPGWPSTSVIVKPGAFCCASRGIIIELMGSPSHASSPEKGKNPVRALAEIIQKLPSICEKNSFFSMITIVHACMGEPSFGVSPGHAKIMATLRTHADEDMEKLVSEALMCISEICVQQEISCRISWDDVFPALYNDREAARSVAEAASSLGLEVVVPETPFRWSEDFGHFTAKYQGALFCIGAGVHCPELHTPTYVFPDRLIGVGVDLFLSILKENLSF